MILNLALTFRNTLHTTRVIKWIVDGGILLSLLPWIYPRPEAPWIQWLDSVLYSPVFLAVILGLYSTVVICYALMRLVGTHTNPALLLSASFILLILTGSFLLMLPRCTYSGISYVDSLFVSTSAVSITGLTSVDISSTFTPFGLIVLALLIQAGALGVMTFTSFFALFFSGNNSVYSQLILRDMIYTRSFSSLLPTLLYILGFTLCIEGIGMAAFFWSIHGTIGMTISDELIFAAFHSLSAFCNAGFSNLEGGLSNPALLYGNQSVYIVATVLICAGSVGFPLLVNIRDAIFGKVRHIVHRLRHRRESPGELHIYSMNSKIVLVTWFLLFFTGAVLFWIFENDNTLAGMSPWEKLVQSIFNSVTPRSAGFSSVNPAGFLNITMVMTLFMMWIGGAAQSTAGGIKVNTLAAMWLDLKATILGDARATAFGRSVSTGSMRRASAIVILSLLSYLVYSLTLMWLEPHIGARELLFESCSALFTVGSSLGITPMRAASSSILLSSAMLLGR
ncbi:MAG: potassium transporter, partial [Muribaculaceae bacterium]|nr:potassium transporter [Muribaculaceae bacterium]